MFEQNGLLSYTLVWHVCNEGVVRGMRLLERLLNTVYAQDTGYYIQGIHPSHHSLKDRFGNQQG